MSIRVGLTTLAVAALAIAGDAAAAIPPDTVEHTVRVMTTERSGQPAETVRQESWVGRDRSRLVGTDEDGRLLAETLYTREATLNFRPGVGLTRWPGVTTGVQPLDALSSARCALRYPGTRRVGTAERLGRAVHVHRWTRRSAGGTRETTTCWIDARTRALLESRNTVRRGARTKVETMRVESTELVPQQPGILELSQPLPAS